MLFSFEDNKILSFQMEHYITKANIVKYYLLPNFTALKICY